MVRVLSFHASYKCRHSGACCTSNWPIPIEADRLTALQAAMANGRLSSVAAATEPWINGPETTVLASVPAGLNQHHCVFFDEVNGRRCRVQSALGHEALPLACRQFPRVCVSDPRGTSVTLSHYCPTAAGLLKDAAPISIVTGASAFPADGEYVGLDARSSLPPLLRPDMLMDWEAWWDWERLAVRAIERSAAPVDHQLRTLRAIVDRVRTWTPDDGDLIDRVGGAFDSVQTFELQRGHPEDRLREVLDAIPPDLRPAHLDRSQNTSAEAARRFLAAHAFANWTAHLGEGLRSWWRSLDAAIALVELGLGVRQADLLLRHLADPFRLAATWSGIEREH